MDLKLTKESFGQDDQSWLASAEGTDRCRSITLDLSTFTANTHYPNGYLKSGFGLTKLGSGLYGLWTAPSGEDAADVVAGHLFTAVKVPSGATKVAGALLWHGAVYAAKLPAAVSAAGQATNSLIAYF